MTPSTRKILQLSQEQARWWIVAIFGLALIITAGSWGMSRVEASYCVEGRV